MRGPWATSDDWEMHSLPGCNRRRGSTALVPRPIPVCYRRRGGTAPDRRLLQRQVLEAGQPR